MFTILFHSLTLSLQSCFIFVVSKGKDLETLTLNAIIMLLLKIDTSYQVNALDVVDVFENHSHSVSSDDGRVTLFYRRRHPYIRVTMPGSSAVWFYPVKTSSTESFRDFFPCDADFYRIVLQFPVVRELLDACHG